MVSPAFTSCATGPGVSMFGAIASKADPASASGTPAEIVDTLDALPLDPQRPTALIAHTVKGKGVSFAEDTYVWHSNSVNDEILAKALAELEEK